MLGVCFSKQACFLSFPDSLLARIGPGDGPDLTSDLRTAICLRYSVCCIKQNLTANKQLRLPEAKENPYQVCPPCFVVIIPRLADLRSGKEWQSMRVTSSFSKVSVFECPCTLIRYICVFICIQFQQRFQIDHAFSVNTLSVFESISGTEGRNASKCMRFQTKTH